MNLTRSEKSGANNVAPQVSLRRVWQSPEIFPLGVKSTETVTFKWFTPDQHIVTADYGTPPS